MGRGVSKGVSRGCRGVGFALLLEGVGFYRNTWRVMGSEGLQGPIRVWGHRGIAGKIEGLEAGCGIKKYSIVMHRIHSILWTTGSYPQPVDNSECRLYDANGQRVNTVKGSAHEPARGSGTG